MRELLSRRRLADSMLNGLKIPLADKSLGRVRPQRRSDEAAGQQNENRRRVCIVGAGSISQNPRVVKEADALQASGYDVVVLFPQHFEWARIMDNEIAERAPWRTEIVDVRADGSGRLRRWMTALQMRLFRSLCHWTTQFPVAELAHSRFFLTLLLRALRHKSDLYIGHYPGSLPVVACAARWTGAKFGFDFEDFHRGESVAGKSDPLAEKLLTVLENRYLPKASFLTAASWGIADHVAVATQLPAPATVLNAFPWSDRASLPDSSARSPGASLSLYWFSQIISLDRGLQDAIAALSLMHEDAELHIRGNDAAGSVARLTQLAKDCGVADRIHFHPILPPGDLLSDAAQRDVGLCLEVPASANKDSCISNKIFLYMLAGLAIVASRTRGQSDVLAATPDVGLLYEPGDSASLATLFDRYARDRELLARTKAAALAAARDRWNWERESQALVDVVSLSFVTTTADIVRQ